MYLIQSVHVIHDNQQGKSVKVSRLFVFVISSIWRDLNLPFNTYMHTLNESKLTLDKAWNVRFNQREWRRSHDRISAPRMQSVSMAQSMYIIITRLVKLILNPVRIHTVVYIIVSRKLPIWWHRVIFLFNLVVPI